MTRHVVAVLRDKHGISEGEAEDMVEQTKRLIMSIRRACACNPVLAWSEAVEIVQDHLGLDHTWLEEVVA